MERNNIINKRLADAVESLSHPGSSKMVYVPQHGKRMPSIDSLKEIVNTLRQILFPGYFGASMLTYETMPYYIGVNIDKVFCLLTEQIRSGICFACEEKSECKAYECGQHENDAANIATEFISRLPKIRMSLASDVNAMFNNDPATTSYGEIIYSYPTIRAVTNYRIANELLKLKVPIIPRIISEMAHSETGIDINPGATIGDAFAIDHGTGVVIGETCVIGDNVTIYQGVTLGAKSFPLDEQGNPIKGVPRHPTVEDGVVIYAQATILGRVTIGANSMIGGNVWLTHSVPPNSKIIQNKARETIFYDGGGI